VFFYSRGFTDDDEVVDFSSLHVFTFARVTVSYFFPIPVKSQGVVHCPVNKKNPEF
jgi:hypothetical protein